MSKWLNRSDSFVWVFEIPQEFPGGFCFNDPIPVNFGMVDWFGLSQYEESPIWTEWGKDAQDQVRDHISKRQYAKNGKPLLVITSFGKTLIY